MPHHARLLGSLVIVLLTVIGLAGLVGPAHAATPDDDRIRAEKLIQEGLTLARGKQFREAIPKFEAALKLYPHPETKHNLGRAHEEVGELKKAHEYFTQALKEEYTFAADGRQRLGRIESELRKSYARVTVRSTPSQVNVALTFPSGEDETHVSTPFQTWVPAGRTRLVASNPNFKTGEQSLDLAAGEDREVNVVLVPLPKQGFLQVSVNQPGATISLSGRVAGKSPLAGLAWEVGVYELEVKLRGYQTHRAQIVINEDTVSSINIALLPDGGGDTAGSGVDPVVGWTLLGTGVALGGAALGMQFGVARPADTRSRELALENRVEESKAQFQKAKDWQLASQITAGVGGALFLVGGYLLLFEQPEDDTAAAPVFVPNVAVTPDGGYVGGTFRF